MSNQAITMSDEVAETLDNLRQEQARLESTKAQVEYFFKVAEEYRVIQTQSEGRIVDLERKLGRLVIDQPLVTLPDPESKPSRELTVGDKVKPVRLVNYRGHEVQDLFHDSVGVITIDWNDGDVAVDWGNNNHVTMSRADLVAAEFYIGQTVEAIETVDFSGDEVDGLRVGDRGVVDGIFCDDDVYVIWSNDLIEPCYMKPTAIRPV